MSDVLHETHKLFGGVVWKQEILHHLTWLKK